MALTVTVSIQNGKGKAKVFTMRQTAEPTKAKNGKLTKAVFQPELENVVILPFGKIYIDTEAM